MMGKWKGLTSWALFITRTTIDATRIRQRVSDGGNRQPREAHRITGDLYPGQVQMKACRSPSAQT